MLMFGKDEILRTLAWRPDAVAAMTSGGLEVRRSASWRGNLLKLQPWQMCHLSSMIYPSEPMVANNLENNGQNDDLPNGDLNHAPENVCSSAHSWVGSVAVCRGTDLAASGAGNRNANAKGFSHSGSAYGGDVMGCNTILRMSIKFLVENSWHDTLSTEAMAVVEIITQWYLIQFSN
ncbi:hypothetical protein Tco_0971300 [Tanacetum coccineum]